MASYVKDECPVCENGTYDIIGQINEKTPPVPVPDGSAVVSCKNCRLIYVNPMPHWDSDDFARLYNDAYFSHMKTPAQKKWLQVRRDVVPHRRFGRIAPQLKADGQTLLEIGAGEYAFMCRHLSSKGWDVTAQEPGVFGAELRKIDGIKVETAGVKDLDAHGSYSLIFADSVLEHVPDPVVYYQKLANMLAPGGVLYTVSPNERSMYNFLSNFIARKNGSSPHYIAPYIEPYHLIGYTKKALAILGEKSGLSLVRYKKIDDYMAFHTLNSARSALVKYPLALLYAVSQTVGLGTNAEALFVKQ